MPAMQAMTISLIGMPGAGKSSVGIFLAKQLGLSFTDTDLLIQVRHGDTLQHILEQHGYLALRQMEEAVLLDIPLQQMLVSTGGSVVYSDAAMQRLRAAGPVVFIDVPLPVLQQRVDNQDERGIAHAPGQDFPAVFEERQPLYQRYADLTIAGHPESAETIARQLAHQLAGGTA